MARAPSLLSVCTRQRILSVVLVVLQLLLLLLLLVSQTSLMTVAEASKIPDYEFHLTFYDKPVPWQKCPEGWVQYGSKCYKTFFQQVSWQEADKVCKSLGGSLVEVKGFNQNQDLGQIIRKCLYQSWTTDHVVSLSTGNMSLHSWIGLKRGVNGDYTWASGRAGHEQQGFWDKGNPPTISSLSSNSHVNEKCCDINLSSTGYGDFRWSLTGCDNKRIFMCETFACNKYQFRCTNSQQCVGSKSVCDGERDCDDGSDELDCGLGVDCGGRLEGPFGTFHSPRFPDLYPDYATCIWQIWTPVGTKVQLQFETFSTELRYDKVEVFDGSERQDSARLGIYSGNQVPVVPLASSNVLLVTFTSDFSQQAHGFNVTWFTESFGDHSEACGGKFSAGTHVQWFTSPLFPTHPYPDNLVCEWIITTHNSSDIITLQFVEFQLDSPYDWVEVHDGPEEQDRLLGHFSGSELPQVIVSTGPCIFVRFKTDLNHGERGFNATYETGCSVNITSGYARISSPGYRANNYRDNTYCVWHIIDNSSRNLTLIFNSDFDTELYMDVVKVYNSSHISERNLVAELSGNVIPAHFHSDGEGFLIIFESDGNVNRPGWTAAISYDCDPLPIKPPLHINTTSVAFGSAVEYQCQEGYILSGPLIAVCGLQAWSPSAVPYCQLIDCGSPSIPMEGYLVHLSNTTYGGVVSYRCNTGYQMQGTNKAVCKDGNWTKLPTCEEIFCPKEPPPSNGTGMAEDNRYGALREYFCNHGYQLIGAKFSHCSANGTWSSPVPQCQIMQCPAIVGLSNGYPSKTGPVSIRDRVVMSCDSGYKMIGSSTLLCTPDLIYDKPLPVCKDIDECSSAEGSICRNGVCQNLPGDFRCICHAGYENPKDDETICKDNNECQTGNGGCSHTCENFQGGYRCTCRPGFQLYNGSLTNYDGLELSPGRTCISVCQPFSVVEGSVFYTKPPLKYGTFLYPAEAFVSCPLGSIPDGPALVKCQQEGGWSASVTACRVSYCPQLNNPDHGTVDTNGLTLNSKASYSCKKGYQLMGTKFRYCQLYQDHSTYIQRFQWTGVDPFCQVNCGVPPNIDNGVALYLHTTLGGEAVYSCDCGYYLTGDVVVQCQENGLWSGNGSTCNVLTCSAPENPIYGIIEQTQYKYSVGSVLEIVCDRPGYDLSDPWPLKCESPVRKQVASALPLYQLAVNSSFETGNNINITFSCGANYQEKAVTLFTQFLSQFEMFCTSPVQRKIVIDSDSSIHISGNRINVTLWAELSIARREVLYDSCTCGEYIAASLKSSFSNMLSSMLESSHDPDCPAVSLLQNTFHASGLGWRCPERLELSGEGPDCWMGIPACWEECEDRIYGTSTLSPYPLNTDNEPITSSLPSETVTTTLPVPVTTSSLPSTYDPSLLSWNVTLSSTDVQSSIASSKPSFTAESETSSESTVKDINVKSTTLPSAISSDVLSKTTLSPSLSVTASSPHDGGGTHLTSTQPPPDTTPTAQMQISLHMQTTTESFARIITSTLGAEQSSLSSQNVGSVTGLSLGLTQSSSTDHFSSTTHRLLTTQAALTTQRNETTQILSTTQAQVATVQTYKATEAEITTQFAGSFATKQTPLTTQASVTMQTPVLLTTHLIETSNVSGAAQPLTVISQSPSTTLGTITTQDHITASQTSGSRESTVISQAVSTVWTYTAPLKSTTQSAPFTHASQTLETNSFPQHTVTTPAIQTTKNPITTVTSQASPTTQTRQTMQGPTSQASQKTLVALTTQDSQTAVTQTSQATRTTQALTDHVPQTTQPLVTTQVPHITQILTTPQTFKTTQASQTSQASVTTPSTITTKAPHTTQVLTTTLGLMSLEAFQTTGNAKTMQSLSTALSFSMTEDHSMTVPQTTQTTTTPITSPITARFLTTQIPQTSQYPQITASHTAMQSMATQVSTTNQKTISTLRSLAASSSITTQTSAKATAQSTQTSSVSITHNPIGTQASLKTAQTSVTAQASAVIPESQTTTVSVTRWDGNGSSATGALTSGAEYTVVATNPVDIVPAFFSLRVEDTLHGSFRNLSCIDAVHLSINKKVVSMMQDFKSHIGKDYCLNASDVIVDLKSGNISFRGNKAEIRIQFSLRSANSSHQAVESCGERFRDFLLKELPAMFSQVVKEVLKGSCENASYPAAGVSVTESDWTCPTDFTLDQELLGCSRSITSTLASTTAATSTPSPTQAQVPVKTIPRMVLTFKGTFVQETQGTGAEKCEDEYTGGLLAFLTDLESAMQNRNASCAAIYVNITANVTLARRGNKYDAESQVILVALDGSVDRPAMHKCAGFVTSELLYSLNHLPNMTLPKSYLQNCPAITMSPGQLSNNATSISYFCPVSYIYDVFNFQCIDETLPSYTIHIDLAITDVTDSNTCQLAIQKAAEDVDQMVVGNTQKLILTGGLCSVSSVGARILLQPQNARLSLAVAQTTISIPLVLVSLNGQIAPVQNCRNELYTYLAVALNLPVKNMTTSIQRACSNAVGPNNYTISSEEWTCFEGSFYNSETHTCVKTGILGKSPTEIIGDSDLKVKRRKRGVWSSLSVNADWNATISSCQDHEAPTFHDCPKMEQRIELGPGGPLPVNISIPEISDNSGGQLFVSFQPPDFHLPYIFHHNMTVNMSVTDSAGNNAVCRMSVGLIDTTPPLVVCPTQVYRQHYAGNSSHIPLVLPLDVVSSWDFSGISHKVFSPSLGTLVPVLQELSITVTVFDFFGNSANCSFIYFIEMDVCPLWTLPEPSGGKRLCPEQVDNLAGKGFSCTVSCSHSYGFISPPPTQYTCVNGSSWQPHNYVPDCALRVYPNQDLNLTLNFTYNGTISNECAKQIGNSLLANLEPVFAKICEIIADNITMNITHMGYFDPQNQFSLKMKVQLVLNTKALVDAARWCGKQIGTKIETFPVQASASCGMASLQPPVDYLVQDTCSDGSILVNGSCLECPQGMHQTGSICMECPSDSYQDQKGQQTCLSCPPGMHTLTNGAKTARECMAPCEPGYYSSNGLVPCFSCPKGWYQSKHRATACDQCISGYSTYSSAATSHENCTAKCWPGLYSLSGLEPCSACPVGFFANETGSHYCLECPWNMTTLSTGSSSYAQCLEIDQCENQPCGYGATCINHFRFFHCICPAGYAGILCDENIDDCASQPCMHGGTCEDHIGYYSCHCRAGFQGTICEQQTNECNSNPCEHGQCIDLNLNYACSCHQGYTGARCEMLIDKCLETPCQHGGMCISRVGGYQCDCTGTGYEGHNCERNINDCSASSCQNGATCNDLLGAFSCLCASGFVGESCEENVDDCNSSPCENGGLCVDGVNSLTCICKPGYTGQQCEEEIDECLSSPCKNGAACIDLLHDYTCSCATGFTGRNCEENIDDCINSLCNMTGTDWCEDGVNSYKCHCLVHWTGKLCQELEDPCFIAPCAEGATCISSGQDFVCTCPADFTGTLCDVQIDNCASRPCLNNGSCVETVHNFMCLCAEGFTGVKCETNVNECWSQPCLNGGTCRDLVNGYACSCVPGYVGEQCEENVDECISQPCLHGATCSDHVSDFHCDCRKGFEGKTCERNVNECLYKPCKNGGTCIDLEGQFLCLCPPNYSGSSCQSGPCSLNDTCQNGATCINSQGKATCLCPPAYAGEDCGKEKSGDYDLWFPGSKDSFCSPPPFVFPGGSEFAVCLWLRFGSSQTRGTYLTLFSIGENDRNNYTMLDMTGNTVSASLFGEVEGRHFELSVTDGKWHHLCYQWAWGQHTLYIDGIMSDGESYLSQEKNLPRSRMRLVLGQPTSTTLGEPFKGLVSHVSLYSYTLKESLMKVMFNNCSMSMVMGDVYSWPQTDAYVKGKVTIIAPGTCGTSQCLPFSDDNRCDHIENKRDRIAPTVVQCPPDQVITNSSVLVQVNWQEPVFEDNVGIISIQQTHRSGQIFQHGEYMVTYVAWDAENNSVDCSFEVIVRPFACVEPLAPRNGAKVCKTWLYGSFCSVTCLPSYMFVEQPPPFYSCGRLGFWDPPRGNPFRFPPCSSIGNPSASLKGGIEFTGPACSEEFKVQLKKNFFRAMWELDAGLRLCTAGVCDFENGFRVTCNPATAIRRRREIADVYNVGINLTITANSSAFQQASTKWLAEKVITAVKQGRFDDSIFIAQHTSAHLTVDYQCLPGQVLTSITDFAAKACFDCPPGYMYDNVTKNCAICGEGSYTEYPRQFHCILCPTGMTTSAPGSTSITACFEVCPQGSYYNLSGEHCELCPKGQYQDTPGQTACSSCPTGHTTQGPGATSVELCRACGAGQELGGDSSCCPCPHGTYRESDEEDFCLSCPYGLTTDTTGSISVSNCTIVVCEKGWYRLETNTCAACLQGTFQPARGTSQCIPCGVGLTTASSGAIHRDQCEPGPVNECVTGSHQCHKHAECMDTENSYHCTCKAGYTGDGYNCTDMCLNYCGDHGVCDYGVKGEPYCNCATGYLGSQCNDKVVKDLSSAMIGGVAGFVVAVLVICIFTALCYWRHRAERKKSQSRIYRTRMSSSAFCNEGYETVREGSNTPSQLIIQEQDSSSSSASSLSIAPRWNRSTFANSDEDETDACWFESLPMDDMSLGCDAFSKPALVESQSYF